MSPRDKGSQAKTPKPGDVAAATGAAPRSQERRRRARVSQSNLGPRPKAGRAVASLLVKLKRAKPVTDSGVKKLWSDDCSGA